MKKVDNTISETEEKGHKREPSISVTRDHLSDLYLSKSMAGILSMNILLTRISIKWIESLND